MDAGTTFLRSDSDKHLWMTISDPKVDAENVLIVNLTSLDIRKENVCVLHVGDHSWVRHDTCVNYADAVITSLPHSWQRCRRYRASRSSLRGGAAAHPRGRHEFDPHLTGQRRHPD
jgi:hypothetical protein